MFDWKMQKTLGNFHGSCRKARLSFRFDLEGFESHAGWSRTEENLCAQSICARVYSGVFKISNGHFAPAKSSSCCSLCNCQRHRSLSLSPGCPSCPGCPSGPSPSTSPKSECNATCTCYGPPRNFQSFWSSAASRNVSTTTSASAQANETSSKCRCSYGRLRLEPLLHHPAISRPARTAPSAHSVDAARKLASGQSNCCGLFSRC